MGTDLNGVQYFEKAEYGRTKKPLRYYLAGKRDVIIDQDSLPAEWDSWIRHRRNLPPTKEEEMRNLAIAEMKKINAVKYGHFTPEDKTKHAKHNFPVYEEFSRTLVPRPRHEYVDETPHLEAKEETKTIPEK